MRVKFRSRFASSRIRAGLRILGAGAMLVALVAGPPEGPAAAAAGSLHSPALDDRPNIVVIMADDLDVHSLETAVQLGLMPALAQHVVGPGLRFTESFVTNSLCCPSRATFLTGLYSHNTGVLSNTGPHGGVARLDETRTLATWLRDAGYRTGHVGKYLNGYGIDFVTGFDSGIPQHDPRHVPPGWDDWQALVDTTTYSVYGYTLNDNGQLVQPAAYQTDELAARAVDFIRESAGATPFFLAVMPLAPHVEITSRDPVGRWRDLWRWTIRPAPRHADSVALPLLPALKPSFNEGDVADKAIWRPQLEPLDVAFLTRQYRNRLESLRALDDLVGRVVGSLALTGQLDRTVIVFTSDNGFLHGEHRLGEKLVAYEESIRVPLYVRVPWARTPRAVASIVLNNDLAPTLAELGQARPSLPMDGRSLVPLLVGGAPGGWRTRLLVEHWWTDSVFEMPSFAAVRTGAGDPVAPGMLYVEFYDQNYAQMRDDVPDAVVFRELYDLALDPFQLDSRHADPARAAQMGLLSQVLGRLRDCGAAPERAGTCQDFEQATVP